MENIVKKLAVFKEIYDKFIEDDRLEIIIDGFNDGLTPEQIAIYANGEFDYSQMHIIEKSLNYNFSEEQISIIANPKFNDDHMDVLFCLFIDGVDIDIIKMIAVPENELFDDDDCIWFDTLRDMIIKLKDNPILHKYSKIKFEPKRLYMVLDRLIEGISEDEINLIINADDYDSACAAWVNTLSQDELDFII